MLRSSRFIPWYIDLAKCRNSSLALSIVGGSYPAAVTPNRRYASLTLGSRQRRRFVPGPALHPLIPVRPHTDHSAV
jgi:hypothetical protein